MLLLTWPFEKPASVAQDQRAHEVQNSIVLTHYRIWKGKCCLELYPPHYLLLFQKLLFDVVELLTCDLPVTWERNGVILSNAYNKSWLN